MKTLFTTLFADVYSLLAREEGQEIVEYALAITLIALACVGGVQHLATALNHSFKDIKKALA